MVVCFQAFWNLLLLLFASVLHPWSAQLIFKLYPHFKTRTSRKPACLHCALSRHTHTHRHIYSRTCCSLLQTLREKEHLSRGLSAAVATSWIYVSDFSTVLKTSLVTSMWWSWMTGWRREGTFADFHPLLKVLVSVKAESHSLAHHGLLHGWQIRIRTCDFEHVIELEETEARVLQKAVINLIDAVTPKLEGQFIELA